MNNRTRTTRSAAALAASIVILWTLGFAGCVSSPSGPGRLIDDIEIIDFTGTVALPAGSPLTLSNLVVITAVDQAPVAADGSFTVRAPKSEKQQLFLLDEPVSDKTVALMYHQTGSDKPPPGFTARATALSLIMANPFFGESTAEDRDSVMTLAEKHDDFKTLRDAIFESMKADPLHTLDLDAHPEFYEQAVHIAQDVLEEFGSEPAAARAAGWPRPSGTPSINRDKGSPDIEFENPRFVYYGAKIDSVNGPSRTPCRLDCKWKYYRFQLWWPPVVETGPEYTDYTLGGGDYLIRLTKGFESFDAGITWQSAHGQATISNVLKGTVFLMDLVAGFRKSSSDGMEGVVLDLSSGYLETAVKEGQVWPGVSALIRTALEPENLVQICGWFFGGNNSQATQTFFRKATGIVGNVVVIVDKVLTAVEMVNEAAPYFYDLFAAPQGIMYFVNDSIVARNYPPAKPELPSGPADVYTGRLSSYLSSSTDPDDEPVALNFSWGDGTESGWSVFVEGGTPVVMSHRFPAPGMYGVSVSARDSLGAESPPSDTLWVVVRNLHVFVDVRPNNYPNRLPEPGRGDVQAAVCGTDSLDVHDILPESVTFEGVHPGKWWIHDKSTPCLSEIECGNPCTKWDGLDDLILMFSDASLEGALAGLPRRQNTLVRILGRLADSTQFEGTDCVFIVHDKP